MSDYVIDRDASGSYITRRLEPFENDTSCTEELPQSARLHDGNEPDLMRAETKQNDINPKTVSIKVINQTIPKCTPPQPSK